MLTPAFIFQGEEGLSKRRAVILAGLMALALSLFSLACTQVVVPTEEAGGVSRATDTPGGFLPPFGDVDVESFRQQVDYLRAQTDEGEADLRVLRAEVLELREKLRNVSLESKERVVADQEIVSAKTDAAGAAADKGLERILERAQDILRVSQGVKEAADKRWDLAVAERDALRAEEARIVELERVNKDTQDNLKSLSDAEALSQVRLAMADDVAELVREEEAFQRDSVAAEAAAEARLTAAQGRVSDLQGRYDRANLARSVAQQELDALQLRSSMEDECGPPVWNTLKTIVSNGVNDPQFLEQTGGVFAASVKTQLSIYERCLGG